MSFSRLSLFHYDVVRELCPSCGGEKFHFVPIGDAPSAASECGDCGRERAFADLSDTSIRRLVAGSSPKREIMIVPLSDMLPN